MTQFVEESFSRGRRVASFQTHRAWSFEDDVAQARLLLVRGDLAETKKCVDMVLPSSAPNASSPARSLGVLPTNSIEEVRRRSGRSVPAVAWKANQARQHNPDCVLRSGDNMNEINCDFAKSCDAFLALAGQRLQTQIKVVRKVGEALEPGPLTARAMPLNARGPVGAIGQCEAQYCSARHISASPSSAKPISSRPSIDPTVRANAAAFTETAAPQFGAALCGAGTTDGAGGDSGAGGSIGVGRASR